MPTFFQAPLTNVSQKDTAFLGKQMHVLSIMIPFQLIFFGPNFVSVNCTHTKNVYNLDFYVWRRRDIIPRTTSNGSPVFFGKSMALLCFLFHIDFVIIFVNSVNCYCFLCCGFECLLKYVCVYTCARSTWYVGHVYWAFPAMVESAVHAETETILRWCAATNFSSNNQSSNTWIRAEVCRFCVSVLGLY